MTQETDILVNSKSYKAIFCNLTLRNYSKIRNFDFIEDAIEDLLKIIEFQKDDYGNLILDENGSPLSSKIRWSSIDNILSFIHCGVKEGQRQGKNGPEIPTIDDLYELTDSPEGLSDIIKIITGTMPQKSNDEKESGNL